MCIQKKGEKPRLNHSSPFFFRFTFSGSAVANVKLHSLTFAAFPLPSPPPNLSHEMTLFSSSGAIDFPLHACNCISWRGKGREEDSLISVPPSSSCEMAPSHGNDTESGHPPTSLVALDRKKSVGGGEMVVGKNPFSGNVIFLPSLPSAERIFKGYFSFSLRFAFFAFSSVRFDFPFLPS